MRQRAAELKLIPDDVLRPWDEAFRTIVAMQPAINKTGVIEQANRERAAKALNEFYINFRKLVAPLDTGKQISYRMGLSKSVNPFLSSDELEGALFGDQEGILKRLREARTATQWTVIVTDFHKVANAMDRYIADQLRRYAKIGESKDLSAKENEATTTIAALEASLKTGKIDPKARDDAARTMEGFARSLRETVAHTDYQKKIHPKQVKGTPPSLATVNDYLSQGELALFLGQL